MRRRLVALTAVATACLLAVASSPATAATSVVVLRFDGAIGASGAVPRGAGSAAVNVGVVTHGGGQATLVASRSGQGAALRLPARPSGGRVAVVSIRNSGAVDHLAPRTRNFTLSAEVKVDGGRDTDGENLVQRGLADDVGQIKVELDGGHMRCTVKGTAGRVTAQTSATIVPGVWYRITCARTGDSVQVTASRLDTGATWVGRGSGRIGDVYTRKAATPMSVGGKLTPANRVATWQPDQLNGVVDNVVYTIG